MSISAPAGGMVSSFLVGYFVVNVSLVNTKSPETGSWRLTVKHLALVEFADVADPEIVASLRIQAVCAGTDDWAGLPVAGDWSRRPPKRVLHSLYLSQHGPLAKE